MVIGVKPGRTGKHKKKKNKNKRKLKTLEKRERKKKLSTLTSLNLYGHFDPSNLGPFLFFRQALIIPLDLLDAEFIIF